LKNSFYQKLCDFNTSIDDNTWFISQQSHKMLSFILLNCFYIPVHPLNGYISYIPIAFQCHQTWLEDLVEKWSCFLLEKSSVITGGYISLVNVYSLRHRKWPIEIVDLPSYKMVMFYSFLYVYQRVSLLEVVIIL
jgi:hypothetical protein